ncbi:MAG: right-handed parallel beta-helix repeat-containing protein [Spirochaetales bacterium]|nr:right-handed parallel beta-helix repeat-containing protein [Spirochaetales bacterium]
MRKKKIILSLLILIPFIIHSADYYIDSLKGNDLSGNGTQNKPYKSIDKIKDTLKSKDKILLHNGHYGKIKFADTPKNLFSDWVEIKAAKGHYPKIESIQIGNFNASFTGTNNKGSFNAFLKFSNLIIQDGIQINGAQHLILDNCRIERTPPWRGSVENIEKTAVFIRAGSNITVQNCEITNTGTAISMRGENLNILNNHIHDITHDGIRCIGAWNSLVEGNKIHGLDDGVDDSDMGASEWNRHCDGIHIYIPGPGIAGYQNHNVTFRSNIIYDCESQGVQFNNYYKTADKVQNEMIIFENNIFGPTKSNVFNNADPVDTLIFRHNTIVYFPEGKSYISPFRKIILDNYTVRISEQSKNVFIYNNILGKLDYYSDINFHDFNIITTPQKDFPYGRFSYTNSNVDFINPESMDGKLKKESIAINKGTRLLAEHGIYEKDIYGTQRDARPDIGAFEYPDLKPQPENENQNFKGPLTKLTDDFEDGNLGKDTYLTSSDSKGLSWTNLTEMKFTVRSNNDIKGNHLSGPFLKGESLILAKEIDLKNFSFEFKATNFFLKKGSGPVILYIDQNNYYKLDIASEAGAVYRNMDKKVEIVYISPLLKLNPAETKTYKIRIHHDNDSINFEFVVNDTILKFKDSFTKINSIFPKGKIGFYKSTDIDYHRIIFDDIKLSLE